VHSVKLFSVKMFHLKCRDDTIIIKVATPEPKLDAGVRSFVFFGETKICNKVTGTQRTRKANAMH
jgi:hypothetical protein